MAPGFSRRSGGETDVLFDDSLGTDWVKCDKSIGVMSIAAKGSPLVLLASLIRGVSACANGKSPDKLVQSGGFFQRI